MTLPSSLGAYYENKIYESDPFQHLDQIGVGKLVKMAAHDGRRPAPIWAWASAASTAATLRAWSSAYNVGLTTSAPPFPVCSSHASAGCRSVAIKNPAK